MAGTSQARPLSDRHRYRRHLHRYRRRRYRLRRGQRHQGGQHAGQSGDRPGARRRGDPAAGRRRTPASVDRAGARHHGRDQRAAAGPDRLARPDRHRRLPAHPRDRAPVGAGGLRQFVFLGEARPDRAAALRARGRRPAEFPRRGAAPAGRGQRPRGGAVLPRAEHPRRRRLPDALLRQPAHERRVGRDHRRGISGMRAVAVVRRAAGISRIRARGDDAGRCVRQAAHGTLPAPRAGRARRAQGQAVPGDAVERRRGERRPRSCASRSPPPCRARPPARSAAPWSPRWRASPMSSRSMPAAPRPISA